MDIFVSFQATSSPETDRLVRTLQDRFDEGHRWKVALRIDFDIDEHLLNFGFESLRQKRIENARCILAVISNGFDDHCLSWIDDLRTSLTEWTPTSRLFGFIGKFSAPQRSSEGWVLPFKGREIEATGYTDRTWGVRAHSQSVASSTYQLGFTVSSFAPMTQVSTSRIMSIAKISLDKTKLSTNPIDQHFDRVARGFKKGHQAYLNARRHTRRWKQRNSVGNSTGPLRLDEFDWHGWICSFPAYSIPTTLHADAAIIASSKAAIRNECGDSTSVERSPPQMTFGKYSTRPRKVSDKGQRSLSAEHKSTSAPESAIGVRKPSIAPGERTAPERKKAEQPDDAADLTWTNQVSLRGFDSILKELVGELDTDEKDFGVARSGDGTKK